MQNPELAATGGAGARSEGSPGAPQGGLGGVGGRPGQRAPVVAMATRRQTGLWVFRRRVSWWLPAATEGRPVPVSS